MIMITKTQTCFLEIRYLVVNVGPVIPQFYLSFSRNFSHSPSCFNPSVGNFIPISNESQCTNITLYVPIFLLLIAILGNSPCDPCVVSEARHAILNISNGNGKLSTI
jgi:hypothetical protein